MLDRRNADELFWQGDATIRARVVSVQLRAVWLRHITLVELLAHISELLPMARPGLRGRVAARMLA